MRLTTFLVGQGVEDDERGRAKLQGEPGGGVCLGVAKRQCSGQGGSKCCLFAGLGFETNEQC
jgi:hypothetical protein